MAEVSGQQNSVNTPDQTEAPTDEKIAVGVNCQDENQELAEGVENTQYVTNYQQQFVMPFTPASPQNVPWYPTDSAALNGTYTYAPPYYPYRSIDGYSWYPGPEYSTDWNSGTLNSPIYASPENYYYVDGSYALPATTSIIGVNGETSDIRALEQSFTQLGLERTVDEAYTNPYTNWSTVLGQVYPYNSVGKFMDYNSFTPKGQYYRSGSSGRYWNNANRDSSKKSPDKTSEYSDAENTASPSSANYLADHLDPSHYSHKDFNWDLTDARFFVIKSYSEDDIHRSIKYQIWCSTEYGNKRLDAAYRERDNKGKIYLFFSVNGSGHFCGVAMMTSALDYEKQAGVWAQNKWKGQFSVKWLYVKDVPNSQLRHIKLENNENKPVTNSRDTQEVPADKGKQVLYIIHQYRHTTSLFDDFQHYEQRLADDAKLSPH